MTFSCLFGSYQYIRLPFVAAQAGNMFQRKIDELFNDIPNVLGIAMVGIMMQDWSKCCEDGRLT